MNFLLALIIVITLFCGTYYSPKMQYFENFKTTWNSYGKDRTLYSGRAWLGRRPRWAPAIIPNYYLPT